MDTPQSRQQSDAETQHPPVFSSLKTSSPRSLSIILIVLGVILVLLFVFFASLTLRQQSDLQFTYNGFDFKKVDFGYQLQLYINQADYPALVKVRHKPQDLEAIPLDDVSFLKEKNRIFITLDPTNKNLTGKTTVAALEIDAFIDNPYLYNIPVNSSFTQPYANATVKTCADVSATDGIIHLDLGDATAVSVEEGCVLVRGETEDDLIMAADRLVLTLLGVMER